MENKVKINEAFTETYVVLNRLNLYNRIPDELKKLIETNYDANYKFSFDKEMPLFNQINNDITRNLLTYIYTTYINSNSKVSEYLENEINNILNGDNNN